MKKLFLIAAMYFIMIFPSCALAQDMRGVWVSSVYNLDFPSSPGLSSAQLMDEADNIIETAYSCGLTDIFLQVRPACDALYKSDIFPSSAYVCITQGESFPDDFDILEYFISKGKEKDIGIHAWINPYRITRGNFSSKEDAMSSLSDDSPARSLSKDVIFHTDGNLYFNPSSQDVRQLITDGILEIVNNYDIKGIHLDDYFYPSADFDDEASYQAMKYENEDIHSFRVRQVDSLIYSLHDAIKSANPECIFGISPFGVWANKSSHPDGSDTNSSQSYYDHYADTLKWVKEEKIDYIMPQLYWNIGNKEADYSKLLQWWDDAVVGTSVKLYTGLAAYRIENNELGYDCDEISSQINMNIPTENCSGFCIFRMSNIDETLFEKLSAYSASNKIYIAIENDEFRTTLPRFHFYGTAIEGLQINGQTVDISPNGYFSVSKPLIYGMNIFTFSSGNTVRTIKIYRDYTLKSTSADYTFTLPYDNQITSAVFTIHRINGSFFGDFDLQNITKEYFNDKTFTVSVSKDDSNVYKNPSTDKGAIGVLDKNTRWKVTASRGDFFYLESLGWIKKDNCKKNSESIFSNKKIGNFSVSDGEHDHTIRFEHPEDISCTLTESENGYSLHIYGVSDIENIPESISEGSIILTENCLVYTFTPSINNDISGYSITSYNGYSDIIFYKKPVSSNYEKPLEGISFLLDAGHGGSQSGALSCSPQITEKDINLEYTLLLGEKLSSLGANVEYTRTDDENMSLDERYNMASVSNAFFVSLHSDSISASSVNNSVNGISLHTNSRHSAQFADFISQNFNDISVNYIDDNSDLYMTKPKNTYAILIENQFVCSPESFELLLSDEYKTTFINSLSDAFCDFFMQ